MTRAVGGADVAHLREPHLRAVVDDRRPGQRHLAQPRELQAPRIAAHDPQEPVHVVVVEEGRLDEVRRHGSQVPTKERVERGRRQRPEGEELAERLIEDEVDAAVETAGEGSLNRRRLDDLAERHALRSGRARLGAEPAPERVRRALGVVAAKAVDTQVEPVPRALDQVLARARIVGVQLGMIEHPEERQVLVRPPGEREPASLRRIPIGDRGPEGWVLRRDVVRDEVEDHAQAARVGGIDELAEVRLRAQPRLDGSVIGRVVAVMRGTREERRQPEARRAEVDDVVEPLQQPADRPAVEPGRGRRRREGTSAGRREPIEEDLVDHRVAQPVRNPLAIDMVGVARRAADRPQRDAEGELGGIDVRHVRWPVAGHDAGDLGRPGRRQRPVDVRPRLDPVADEGPVGLARDQTAPLVDVAPGQRVPGRRNAFHLGDQAALRDPARARRIGAVRCPVDRRPVR